MSESDLGLYLIIGISLSVIFIGFIYKVFVKKETKIDFYGMTIEGEQEEDDES